MRAGGIFHQQDRLGLRTLPAGPRFVAMAGEMQHGRRILETIQELNIYDAHDAMDLYRDYLDELRDDPGATRDKIMQAVGRIEDNQHAARLLIRVCVAIGKADEDFSEPEKAVIMELCQRLALDSRELGL